MLADDMVEEGISNSIRVYALQWDQHYHLTKSVHKHHDSVVAAVFRQVRDEVDVNLLTRGLRNWQWLVQASQLTCVKFVALTNIAVLTMLTYVIPHAWPVVPLSSHCVSALHTKMATHVMELVKHHQHQSLGYKQMFLVGQKLPQTIFQHRIVGTLAMSQMPIPPQQWVAPLSIPKLLKEAWQ